MKKIATFLICLMLCMATFSTIACNGEKDMFKDDYAEITKEELLNFVADFEGYDYKTQGVKISAKCDQTTTDDYKYWEQNFVMEANGNDHGFKMHTTIKGNCEYGPYGPGIEIRVDETIVSYEVEVDIVDYADPQQPSWFWDGNRYETIKVKHTDGSISTTKSVVRDYENPLRRILSAFDLSINDLCVERLMEFADSGERDTLKVYKGKSSNNVLVQIKRLFESYEPDGDYGTFNFYLSYDKNGKFQGFKFVADTTDDSQNILLIMKVYDGKAPVLSESEALKHHKEVAGYHE